MHERALTTLAVVVAAGGACGPAARPSADPPAAAAPLPPSDAAPPAAAPDPPLVLPAGGEAAPWLEPPLETSAPELPKPVLVGVGSKSALVALGAQAFLVDEKRGVFAMVALPAGATPIGLAGRSDAVLAVTGEALLIAPNAAAATRADGFAVAYRVSGVDAADVAGDVVVLRAGGKLHVSRDGGRKFQVRTPPADELTTVLARRDGVIVVQKPWFLWVSRDLGKRWTAAEYVPDGEHHPLRRRGAAIWNGDEQCPVTLSSDGHTWVAVAPAEVVDWADALRFTEAPEGIPPGWRETASAPRAPKPADGERVDGAPICPIRHSARSSIGAIREIECRLAGCVRYARWTEPLPTPTRFSLLGDGACVAEQGEPGMVPDCTVDPFVRAAHVVTIDQRTARISAVGEPPPGCGDEWSPVLSVGGLGLLACPAGEAWAIWEAGPDLVWRPEGTFPLDERFNLARTDLGPDGTLLVGRCSHDAGAPPCAVLTRAPRAVGDAAAWRLVAVPGAVFYRAAPGGGVLAVVPEGDSRVQLVYDRGDGSAPTPLTAPIEITADLREVEIDPERRVRFKMGDREDGRWFLVTGTGRLTPAP